MVGSGKSLLSEAASECAELTDFPSKKDETRFRPQAGGWFSEDGWEPGEEGRECKMPAACVPAPALRGDFN